MSVNKSGTTPKEKIEATTNSTQTIPRHIIWLLQPYTLLNAVKRQMALNLLTPTHPKKQTLSFLDLPYEIREVIYRYALVHDAPIFICPTAAYTARDVADAARTRSLRREYRKSLAVHLLHTCRFVRSEAAPILYGANTFRTSDFGGWLGLHAFLLQIGPANARHLAPRRVVVEAPGQDYKLSFRHQPRWLALAARLPACVTPRCVGDAVRICTAWYSDVAVFQPVCRLLKAAAGSVDCLAFEDASVPGYTPGSDYIRRWARVLVQEPEDAVDEDWAVEERKGGVRLAEHELASGEVWAIQVTYVNLYRGQNVMRELRSAPREYTWVPR